MIGKTQHRLEVAWIILMIPSVIWLLPALYSNLWLPFFIFIIPPCILGVYITFVYDILRIGKNNSRGDNRQQEREQRDNTNNNSRHEQQARQQNNPQQLQQQLSKKERQRLQQLQQQQNQRQRS